jgi:hypothetical protein
MYRSSNTQASRILKQQRLIATHERICAILLITKVVEENNTLGMVARALRLQVVNHKRKSEPSLTFTCRLSTKGYTRYSREIVNKQLYLSSGGLNNAIGCSTAEGVGQGIHHRLQDRTIFLRGMAVLGGHREIRGTALDVTVDEVCFHCGALHLDELSSATLCLRVESTQRYLNPVRSESRSTSASVRTTLQKAMQHGSAFLILSSCKKCFARSFKEDLLRTVQKPCVPYLQFTSSLFKI